ncbi:calponin homology domain-containing protein DDB_G0272472-like [Physella acuta]|uniref:calponin homology domain-containing protein DDB_G0272472-like n=1 Tax=Physella acuta TaxID=109671 RepID=UPI0027DB75EF|nr:calponin homology domain-containing protein DDB_G0272472-like [Physella acuta]XP_059151303.1 calponin homology domain-containing protein DDB_G0272472-like [Physella acuta]
MMPGRELHVPDNLRVTGRGLSPTPNGSTASSDDVAMSLTSRSSMSEDEDQKSDDYTVLDGVREMNMILNRQIEVLRDKIRIDERNYCSDRAVLLEKKEKELDEKEQKIEELRESVSSRDEQIHKLSRAGVEKDRIIAMKHQEIEALRKAVKETREFAQKIQRQVTKVRQQKTKLAADPMYQKQNEEIVQLNEEMDMLKDKVVTMEMELERAMKVIDQQSALLKSMDTERQAAQAKLREDLDKATKSMRHEVERMREVMKHNYDEMRDMKRQNEQMRDDVREIKEILRGNQALTAREPPETKPPITRSRTVVDDRLFTQRPQPENDFVGPGKMVGKSMGPKSNRNVSNINSQSLEPVRGTSPVKAQPKTNTHQAQRSQPNFPGARLEPQARSSVRAVTPGGAATSSNLNSNTTRNLLPPIICSVQEGGILPAGKAKTTTVKRATTFKK